MKRLLRCAGLLLLAVLSSLAHAGGQEIRTCDFDLKGGCRSGQARVTLADGKVIGLDLLVIWCGRAGIAKAWTLHAVSIRRAVTERDPTKSDRIKVTVGRDVTLDLNETQSIPRCGAGAELPQTIVIPAHKAVCRVRFGKP